MKIAIVPAGAWGTALAVPAATGGHEVHLWRRTAGWTQGWDRGHKALGALRLPENVHAQEELEAAVSGADLVILGPASVALRQHCRLIRPHLKPGAVVLSIVKGLEPETQLRMSQVIEQEIPELAGHVAVLSGPNFATEVAQGLPTATVIACADTAVAEMTQDALMTANFRIYTNPDVVGVELGGALKNIIAVGVGMSDGLGMGDNARAGLITRGLTEIARLGVMLGANVLTFAGLAGMGDLVLTCTGDSSRNRRAGLAIGRGQSGADFVEQTHLTVEGIPTTRAVWSLAQRLGVRMPITEQINRVLYEGLDPKRAVQALMTREKTHEVEEQLNAVPNVRLTP